MKGILEFEFVLIFKSLVFTSIIKKCTFAPAQRTFTLFLVMSVELLQYIGLFIVSLAVLLKASDWFINSAEAIGLSFGISPFIIGVTIIAFGTSLPELATSVASVIDGTSQIVIANVVGSNLTNIALVLGIVAIMAKQINMEYNIWHIDMPYLWGSAFLLWFAVQDLYFSMFEAALFLCGIIIFLSYSFGSDNGDDDDEEKEEVNWKTYLLLVVGGVLVWLGAVYTIKAITELSTMAGVSPDIIAITAVALGTSLPEVIVSVKCAFAGKTSIAVGNVLGSNIFNTYVVMGIARLFGELTIPENIITLQMPIMIVMTILFGIMSNNKKITKWEGMVLLMFYAFFIAENLKEI